MAKPSFQDGDAKSNGKFSYLKVGEVLTEAYINARLPVMQFEVAHQLNRRTESEILSGPTSITIEEWLTHPNWQPQGAIRTHRKLTRKRPEAVSTPTTAATSSNRNNRNGGNSPGGGNKLKPPFNLPAETKKDSIIIDKLPPVSRQERIEGLGLF
ncbi:MAG: hypothetical protein IPN76_04165 [Saprospiraceae bacterium]|nr:hypothetical protein [Saprospiraceae bacterium]